MAEACTLCSRYRGRLGLGLSGAGRAVWRVDQSGTNGQCAGDTSDLGEQGNSGEGVPLGEGGFWLAVPVRCEEPYFCVIPRVRLWPPGALSTFSPFLLIH